MPSVLHHPSKANLSAFKATITVLITFLLVAVVGLLFVLRRISRQRAQRPIPCLTGIRTITSPAPFSPDYHKQLPHPPPPAPNAKLSARPIRPTAASSSRHAAPRIPSQAQLPVIRVSSPKSPAQISTPRPRMTTPPPGVAVNKLNASARSTWSSDSIAMPIASDTTQISDDDIHTLGVRGVVNQGFAEMLARRKKHGSKFTALLGSEEGSTVASGDFGDRNSMSIARRFSRRTERGSRPTSVVEPPQGEVEETRPKLDEDPTPRVIEDSRPEPHARPTQTMLQESKPELSAKPIRKAVGHETPANKPIRVSMTSEEKEHGRVREMTRAWERLHGRTIAEEGDDEEDAPLTPIARPAPLVVRKVATFPGPEAG